MCPGRTRWTDPDGIHSLRPGARFSICLTTREGYTRVRSNSIEDITSTSSRKWPPRRALPSCASSLMAWIRASLFCWIHRQPPDHGCRRAGAEVIDAAQKLALGALCHRFRSAQREGGVIAGHRFRPGSGRRLLKGLLTATGKQNPVVKTTVNAISHSGYTLPVGKLLDLCPSASRRKTLSRESEAGLADLVEDNFILVGPAPPCEGEFLGVERRRSGRPVEGASAAEAGRAFGSPAYVPPDLMPRFDRTWIPFIP